MADRNILPVDYNLKKIREQDKIRQQELDMMKLNKKKDRKRKKRRVIITIVSMLTATTLAATGFGLSKKNKKHDKKPNNTIENNIDDNKMKTSSLDDLGVELEFPNEENNTYSNPSGNINVNDIVRDSKGTLWANKQAESKKNEVGKVVTDTKGDTLVVKPNGDVFEKEPSYQIKDENGNVKEEGNLGNNSIPNGYTWDSVIGKYVPKNEVGKYIKDPEGNIWLKEDYEDYLKSQESTKTETEVIPMNPTNVEESIQKPTTSGAYYDDRSGFTFESKEHYNQWVLQGFEGYGIVKGIMVPKTDEMIKADEKVLTK